jgi:DNA-binding PadR family transcriptional regulator
MKLGSKTRRTPRPKAPTLRVLVQFLGADRPLSVFDIRSTRSRPLSKGTLYPMLARLEQRGWLSAKQVAGRRTPKRVYRLTRTGLREARALARQHARMAGGRWIIDDVESAAASRRRPAAACADSA